MVKVLAQGDKVGIYSFRKLRECIKDRLIRMNLNLNHRIISNKLTNNLSKSTKVVKNLILLNLVQRISNILHLEVQVYEIIINLIQSLLFLRQSIINISQDRVAQFHSNIIALKKGNLYHHLTNSRMMYSMINSKKSNLNLNKSIVHYKILVLYLKTKMNPNLQCQHLINRMQIKSRIIFNKMKMSLMMMMHSPSHPSKI